MRAGWDVLVLLLFAPAAGFAVEVPASGGYFPYFADGAGWTTTFHLTCMSSSGCIADIAVYGSDGRNLPVRMKVTTSEFGNDVVQDVAGARFNLQLYRFSSVMLQTLGTAPSLTTGSLDMTANGPMAGFAVLRQRAEGRADYEATVPIEPRSFYDSGTVAFDHRGGGATGIAVANLSATSSAEIRVQGLDLGGNILFSTVLTLEARNSMAFDAALRYPETRNRAGIIRFFVPGGAIGGMAFRFNPTGPFTTTPFFTNDNR
ncbi:hypothetical protein F183_A46890 [Bryobacterales bacterium F-183]|nr:hypothetical protein F183_A46890 [Bryobacterales bacterium F-183]